MIFSGTPVPAEATTGLSEPVPRRCRSFAAEHGTNPDGTGPAEFPVAKRVYIAVDEDAGRARERMAAALIDVYGAAFGSGLLPVTVHGPPDACVRGLREVADAGAGMILLTALFDQPAQMERLAAEVVPHLS